jgi:hypothetical protein
VLAARSTNARSLRRRVVAPEGAPDKIELKTLLLIREGSNQDPRRRRPAAPATSARRVLPTARTRWHSAVLVPSAPFISIL